jgi:hypothetical protein
MKDFETNPELVPKTNTKILKDAIEIAKKIVDGDTNYERTQ